MPAVVSNWTRHIPQVAAYNRLAGMLNRIGDRSLARQWQKQYQSLGYSESDPPPDTTGGNIYGDHVNWGGPTQTPQFRYTAYGRDSVAQPVQPTVQPAGPIRDIRIPRNPNLVTLNPIAPSVGFGRGSVNGQVGSIGYGTSIQIANPDTSKGTILTGAPLASPPPDAQMLRQLYK